MRTGFPPPDDVPGWRLLVVRVLRCVWFFLGMQHPHVPEDAQLQPESLSCAVRVGDATDVPVVCTGKPLGNAALSKPDLFPGKRGRKRKNTFQFSLRSRIGGRFGIALADAFYVDLLGFAEFSTVLALSDRSTFLLYFEEWAIKVFAGGRPMAFDASFAGVFFVADNHF